jgi:agmatine deiminase
LNAELLKNVFFYHIPTDSSWARDIGPIFVREVESGGAGAAHTATRLGSLEKQGGAGFCAVGKNGTTAYELAGKLVITDWVFNAWGDKYGPYDQDDVVPQQVGKLLGLPVVQPGIVLEGGSIDVNGRGTLLTTEQCLLNKNRNPSLTRAQIEKFLNDYLGARHVLWLKEGIVGDDTDGHIDDVARFVSADTVVCAVETNKQDENYQILQACCNDLLKMKDQDGNPLKVVKLPMPLPVVHNGQRLPASYANFLITNKSVLVPTFRCERDGEALAVLAKCFPGRKIVGIDCWDLVWGLGTIHCSTQQQPVSVRPGVR